MRWIKGTANAILLATLIRPVARRLIARARRRAQEHPVAPLMVPAEGLLEAALLAELTASEARSIEPEAQADLGLDVSDAADEVGGRSTVRAALLVGLVVAAATATAYAIAIIRRRRRAARTAQRQIDLVAVPIETPSEAPQEAAVS